MNRPPEVLHGGVTATRARLLALLGQSARDIMLGTILLASVVSGAIAFVLAQYFSVDVLSSLLAYPAYDCWLDWGMQIGRHCFSDYSLVVGLGMRPNPWEPYPMLLLSNNYQPFVIEYPAAAMVPHLVFGLPAAWLGAPKLGLIGYLLALSVAVLSPAVWAARGARGLERVVVFVALSVAAVPAWAVIDRGNSVGFVVPIALVFLVALCRQRWGLVALMVVLAALIKPQFVVLAVALLAARQWRWGGLAIGAAVIAHLGAYLLWPQDFPGTILQSFRTTLDSGGSFQVVVGGLNVSFARGLLLIPDIIATVNAGGAVPEGFLAGPRYLLGYGVLVVVVVFVVGLGRRIPPVMAGIALLATAALFPAVSNLYYLVFVLPIAALVARNPDGPAGSGIFDRLGILGERRRAVGLCVSLAAALSIVHIALPIPPIQVPISGQMGVAGVIGTTPIVPSTVILAPLLWLTACAAIIISYARRPAPLTTAGASTTSAPDEPTPATASHSDR
jgi:hypothetical protein